MMRSRPELGVAPGLPQGVLRDCLAAPAPPARPTLSLWGTYKPAGHCENAAAADAVPFPI